ncbi:MAG: DUF6531 domain-containing protein, partial [Burkholderiaceae bacterium]|nr:DUF6531 domain-containing protein [Burkholderiaceae bacterium]
MLVNGLPAARLGDATFDGGPIVQGSSTVLFNGRPASRQGDATLYGGPITSGSPNVLIGTPGGVADSCCIQQSSQTPATTPNPVHVQLGAKVLTGPEDMDFALPGALPLVWQRQYSSRVSAEHGAACGALGHGWHLLNEVTLQLKDESIEIFDAGGRVITFEQGQPPGGLQYSRSEDIYLFRGGKDDKGRLPNWSYQERFTQVPPELAGDENCILAASGSAEVLWVFNPAPEPPRAEAVEQAADKAKQASKAKAKAKATGDKAQVQEAIAADQAAKQAAPGQCWRLTAQIDRFGRSQRYEYSDGKTAQPVPGQRRTRKDAIPPAGRLMAITDGVGRRYRLTHQRIHNGHEAQYPWGADDGWRLVAVELERDPLYPLPETIMLVRYGYSRQGQLSTVHDRAGALVREFEWSRNRISGHRYRGGPWHRYRYEGQEPNVRVAAHTNEQGLDYSFEYQTDPPTPEGVARHTTIVTDSFKRVQTHHFEGEQGLERLFEHVRADGTVMQYKHDGFGRLYASTDPLGRSLYRQLDGNGNIKGTQQTPGNDQYPAGLLTRNQFDKAGRITESVDPAGAVTRYQYDGHQRLRTIEYPDGTAEHYRYPDPKEQPLICDNPSQIIDAKGGIKHLAYNPAGQLTRFTDCSGQSTHSEYDRWGEVIEIIDAQGNRTRHERDAAGRISATHMPNGQTRRYQYDSQGNLSRIEPDADTPAAALEITRDLWGRPARIEQGGLSVQIEYDKAGRLITLTNENGSKSRFVWDVMDRLVQETGFDGRVQRYRRDAAGQLIASKDGAGQEDDPVTQYCYDVFGRMTERLLSLSGGGHAQSQRLEFDALTRLKAASVYHLLIQQSGGPIEEHLQSRVEFERDGMGRITAEVQRLYREPAKPDQPPVIEYEHRIEHTLDQQGNRQQSQLQGLGGIDWLRYGSGHVHGLMHNRLSLIDFERDSLHRETKRTLHGLQGTGELTLTRSRDSLGRLSGIDLQGLKATNLPPILVGQITNRQYHYNPLSELIAIQMPDETLGFGYDAAGRLRAQARYDTREYMQALAGQAIPRSTRRWKIDPAGNRLPVKLAEENQQRQDWAAAVYENWKDPSFNLLQNDSATNTP